MTKPSASFTVKPGAPSHLGLKVVARPRPGLTLEDLIERMDDLNPDYEVRPEGVVLEDAVYVNGNYVDHSQAVEGELVWACDHCGAYSRTKALVTAHEPICTYNPDNCKET